MYTDRYTDFVYEDLPDYLELTRADWTRIVDHYRVPYEMVAHFIRLRSEPLYRQEFEAKWDEEPSVDCFEDWARQASDLDWLDITGRIQDEEAVDSIENLTPAQAWNDLAIRDDYLALMRLNHELAEWGDTPSAADVIDNDDMDLYYGRFWEYVITSQDLECAARSNDPSMEINLEAYWNTIVEPDTLFRWTGQGLRRHVLHTLHLVN